MAMDGVYDIIFCWVKKVIVVRNMGKYFCLLYFVEFIVNEVFYWIAEQRGFPSKEAVGSPPSVNGRAIFPGVLIEPVDQVFA